MTTSQKYSLTPQEILALWNTYLTHSMTMHVTEYFLIHAEDAGVRTMLEMALQQSKEGFAASKQFFEQAGHPLPEAFSKQDVNKNAPKVYTDDLVILLKWKLANDASVVISMALATASRSDIRAFCKKELTGTADLISACGELIHKRGLHHPELHIPVPEQIEKMESKSFLGNIFAGTRPLSVAEIFNLVPNFQSTEVVSVTYKSFARFTASKELRTHYTRGAEVMDKQLEIFQAALTESGLPKRPTWESHIIETDVSPFSDRLMMFKCALMLAATAGRYGVAVSTVLRKDIGVDFMRLMQETLLLGQENIHLMIKHEFLDQHPLARG